MRQKYDSVCYTTDMLNVFIDHAKSCYIYCAHFTASVQEYLDYAVASCPVDCIYWVSREELQAKALQLQ